MKSRDFTRTGQEPARLDVARPGGAFLSRDHRADESSDLVDGTRLLRVLEENHYDPHDPADTRMLPRITRMPAGIEVVEQRAGSATAQWVLRVRCQCGRGWFEVEACESARCPRCGLLVYLDVEAPIPPR
jgi:hypothetical protein